MRRELRVPRGLWYNIDVAEEKNKKRLYETDAVKEFAAGMSKDSQDDYNIAKGLLRKHGRLQYPEGKKLSGYKNLFEIRILRDGNERFFYAYDDGDTVVIAHAFAKDTQKTPKTEIKKALKIIKKLI